MTTLQFRASVQYGDLTGTAAADRADKTDGNSWLVERKLKQDHELLIGITMDAGETHGVPKGPVHVQFLLADRGDYDTVKAAIDAAHGPFPVRCVKVKMPIAEFLGMFKRFSVNVSTYSLLEGKEYTYRDE